VAHRSGKIGKIGISPGKNAGIFPKKGFSEGKREFSL
jgi:hypothetical protein